MIKLNSLLKGRLAWVAALALVAAACVLTGCGSDSGGGVGSTGAGGGFLWKPRSESNGKLVVLLPSQYRQQVDTAYIARSDGSLVETGVFSGDTHNGNRPHYRFTQTGAAYGLDLLVVADLTAGGSVNWSVPNGAARTTY